VSPGDVIRGWAPPALSGRVAVVTGASRGVGKGIAVALGECGATVYVTGRSTRERPSSRRGTVDETAEEVSVRGGRGVPVPTDHVDDGQVVALFERVRADGGGLDLLVANAWGGYEGHDHRTFGAPFWEQPVGRWDAMFTAGLRAQFTAARLAAPVMIDRGGGLIVCIGGNDDPAYYLGNVAYDVVKAATVRFVTAVARELRPHSVAVVGVYPGFTRTEAVVDAFAAGGAQPPEETHSPEFVGRAVAHLLADPGVMELSGSGAQAAVYARRYGFRDVDGREIEPFVLPAEYRL
jgi:NAD(P)-dependent dehydrogenase (short-subunit alcohol dehydrogenase family)